MSKFKLGEIAIALPNEIRPLCECEIKVVYGNGLYEIEALGYEPAPSSSGWYQIAEECLRKKKPPKREQTTTWDQITDMDGKVIWHPEGETV